MPQRASRRQIRLLYDSREIVRNPRGFFSPLLGTVMGSFVIGFRIVGQ
jgi:hypothetical protein